MASSTTQRVHYYERQYLGVDDFQTEQDYFRDLYRRHNLGPHLWGIVTGLDLVEVPPLDGGDGVDVYVMPGLAIDGFGRQILVTQPYQLPASAFSAFIDKRYQPVWIEYAEQQTLPPPYGYQGCAQDQFARITETFQIVVGNQSDFHSNIVVNGQQLNSPNAPVVIVNPAPNGVTITVPDDESVPSQDLPDETLDRPRWLVELGSVQWDGTHKPSPTLIHSDPAKLTEGRHYAGLVAQDLLSAASILRLRPRVTPADPNAADFASIEGRLRVDGDLTAKHDILLRGGKLSFQTSSPQAADAPLWMQRTTNAKGADLRVHIGDSADANTRLTVGTGPADGSNEKVTLAVKGDDTVDIPTGTLNFGAQTRQMLNLWNSNYGVGVQNNTLYFRTDGQVIWYKGGAPNDDPDDAGQVANRLLLLDSGARLHFGAQTRQMLNLWDTQYGIGVQSSTLYFRSFTDFCWFRGGSHSDARSDPGAGGALAMRLDPTSSLSVTGGLSTGSDLIVGNNNSSRLITRHVSGKHSFDNGNDNLYLNYGTGFDVVIGNDAGGATSGLRVTGDLTVNGRLLGNGADKLVHIITRTVAVQNAGQNNPANWNVFYFGEFAAVPTAFVVLQGFSIWGFGGNTNFNPNPANHLADPNTIVQHMFVRITSTDQNQTSGLAYCSESLVSNETDNTVLFTVVLIGRGA